MPTTSTGVDPGRGTTVNLTPGSTLTDFYGGWYARDLGYFEAITYHASICLHMDVVRGRDPHHIVEAQFKAFARALRAAVEDDPRVTGVPSTKGAL